LLQLQALFGLYELLSVNVQLIVDL